ncbi:ubiquitin C-terminal hydrolase Ubp14 [Tieghemiomyces parasiticus]|uniref:Ubiquitin carboxyl-terminal hydrolase n=1 Tax=Tieghemiomyces parasiticus TaxID=78921 RepID=A0A9W7ZNQ8_9FUNG|nr:ubiquitin C-terminal hydrolase Ubp14 [Tieghemiomyces parasiticus]
MATPTILDQDLCEHVLLAPMRQGSGSNPQVFKDECTLCFDDQDASGGLDVCLDCFNGGCTDEDRHHGLVHHRKTDHPLALNIRRTLKSSFRSDNPKPPKITKLAIVESQDDETKYDHSMFVKCYKCAKNMACAIMPEPVALAVTTVVTSLSATKKSEIASWEEESAKPCPHTLHLTQNTPPGPVDLTHCRDCDLRANLWLCMTCGSVGCGRRQYDGSGGNNHGVQHYEQTGHAVSCKLGTLSPEGTADLYCYLCDDAVLDCRLADHLLTFGINVAHTHKTDKTMAELQLEKNIEFDFSMTTEDGQLLTPVFGPGLTGLANLGNSCYMASVLQCVMAQPTFRDRYFALFADHSATCPHPPASCFFCQTAKLAEGMASGRYSQPIQASAASEAMSEEEELRGQAGLTPRMYKMLIGADHAEFATMRQQDAFEFWQHLVKVTEQKERAVDGGRYDPTRMYRFTLEERLQCLTCHRIRYTRQPAQSLTVPIPATAPAEGEPPVTLAACLDRVAAPETIEQYHCPQCEVPTTVEKTVRFHRFPEVLVLHMQRFQLVDWVPRKVETPVEVALAPEASPLNLDRYRSLGQQPGEELLPDPQPGRTSTATTAVEDAVDEAALIQLTAMGFPEVRCRKALRRTGNAGAEVAMNWLFEHMDDPDIDDPEPNVATDGGNGGTAAVATAVSEGDLDMLMGMGFNRSHATRALQETGGSMERAVEWIFSHPEEQGVTGEVPASTVDQSAPEGAGSDDDAEVEAARSANYTTESFVSHRGTSVHCGHYVAHVWHPERRTWVLFNDNKAVAAPKPAASQAYVYFLRRGE